MRGDIQSVVAVWLAAGVLAALQVTSADWVADLLQRGTTLESAGVDGGKGVPLLVGAIEMLCRGRAPNLHRPPEMHFFSAQQKSRACKNETAYFLIKDSTPQDRENRRAAIDRELVQSGAYDPQLVTYVVIHGFGADWNSGSWLCDVKDQILKRTDANVFILDWCGGSKPHMAIDYGMSVANVRREAELVASFLRDLHELAQDSPANLHLIGHSMGAHLAGLIGHQLGESSVGRITALDAAGPCFSSSVAPKDRRLTTGSAKHVLALHTNAGFVGLDENCGHTDVYVNGGKDQPGCFVPIPGKVLAQLLDPQVDKSLMCSHMFSLALLDSVYGPEATPAPDDNQCTPMGYVCDSWELFNKGACGFCLDNDGQCTYTGVYLEPASGRGRQVSAAASNTTRHYASTSANKPNCIYQYQVLVATTREFERAHQKYDLQITWDELERTVRVGHKLAPESDLAPKFLKAMRRQYNSSSVLDQLDNETNLHTGLLTFQSQVASDSCTETSNALCNPLGRLSSAHLLASSREQLEAVEWMAMHYMSGVSLADRLGQSQLYVVERDDDGSVARDAGELPFGQANGRKYYAKLWRLQLER